MRERGREGGVSEVKGGKGGEMEEREEGDGSKGGRSERAGTGGDLWEGPVNGGGYVEYGDLADMVDKRIGGIGRKLRRWGSVEEGWVLFE